jgi:predicted ATPase
VARITKIWAKGMRSLADVALDLDGLTVLIGESGSGKSTVVELCAVLQAFGEPDPQGVLERRHGDVFGLARWDAEAVQVGCEVETEAGRRGFRAALSRANPGRPTLSVFDGRDWLNLRDFPATQLGDRAYVVERELDQVPLRFFRREVAPSLAKLSVQVPADATPLWVARHQQREPWARREPVLRPTSRLELQSANLPNAWFTLKNQRPRAHWDETLEIFKLGLGTRYEDIAPEAISEGNLGLALVLPGGRKVSTKYLSDGELSWLSLLAAIRLADEDSMLVFDEPDLHLHPRLLGWTLELLRNLSERVPVLITTHSDRLLDLLPDPAKSVVVCERDEQHATVLRRLDAGRLTEWLDGYSGLGALRADGFLDQVLAT